MSLSINKSDLMTCISRLILSSSLDFKNSVSFPPSKELTTSFFLISVDFVSNIGIAYLR